MQMITITENIIAMTAVITSINAKKLNNNNKHNHNNTKNNNNNKSINNKINTTTT